MKAPETVQCKNCLFRGLFISAGDEPGSRAKSQPKDGLGLDILATAANWAFRQNMMQGKRDCFLPVVFLYFAKAFFSYYNKVDGLEVVSETYAEAGEIRIQGIHRNTEAGVSYAEENYAAGNDI